MTRYRAHRPRVLAALLGMVLGGLGAGTATMVAGPAGIGSVLGSLSAEIALAEEPRVNGGASAPGAGGPRLAGPPISHEWTQPGGTTTTTTTSQQSKPKSTSKPKPATSTSQAPPTRTSSSTRHQLTIKPDVTTAPTTTSDPTSTQPTLRQRVVRLVNEVRAEHGCGPVTVDERIERAASKHSTDMAQRNYFSHDTPEGVGFAERIENEGYPRPGAENIAKGYRTAEDVMDGWMNSEGHRANILNCDLGTIGVGIDTDGWLWTQDFGY